MDVITEVTVIVIVTNASKHPAENTAVAAGILSATREISQPILQQCIATPATSHPFSYPQKRLVNEERSLSHASGRRTSGRRSATVAGCPGCQRGVRMEDQWQVADAPGPRAAQSDG